MTVEFTHSPLLGTLVEVRVGASTDVAERADRAAVAEFQRLDAVFSTYRDDSELNRWRRDEVSTCSPDLLTVLEAAQEWYEASAGAFHPATGMLRQRWLAAHQVGAIPSPAELSALADGTRSLPYRVSGTTVQRLDDCTGLDLNGIAKGYIVDRAATAAAAVPGVSSVMVNAGGDLRHRGEGTVLVGVEDPARPFDNQPPRWSVRVADGGLATSGSARRGFQVGERWLGHVLDPRTGWPVEHTTSVTVLARDTMTADVLATVLGVLEPNEAIAFAASRGIGCLLVDSSGTASTSPDWPS